MEFLPPGSNAVPLVPGQGVTGLTLEGLPLLVVDRYMYLGILMTPGLSILSMVKHCGARAGNSGHLVAISAVPNAPNGNAVGNSGCSYCPLAPLWGQAVWHEPQTHGHNAGSHEPRYAGKHWGQEGRVSAISWALEGDWSNTSLCVGWCTTGEGLC
jgi:hypothetical protein